MRPPAVTKMTPVVSSTGGAARCMTRRPCSNSSRPLVDRVGSREDAGPGLVRHEEQGHGHHPGHHLDGDHERVPCREAPGEEARTAT